MGTIENKSISNIPKEEKDSSPVLNTEEKTYEQLSEEKTLKIMREYGLNSLPIDTSTELDNLTADIDTNRTYKRVEEENLELKYVLLNWGKLEIPPEDAGIGNNNFTVLGEQQEENTHAVRESALRNINNITENDKNLNQGEVSINYPSGEENPSVNIVYKTDKTLTTLEIKKLNNGGNSTNKNVNLSSSQYLNSEGTHVVITESVNSGKEGPEQRYNENGDLIPLPDDLVKDKKNIYKKGGSLLIEGSTYSNKGNIYHKETYSGGTSINLINNSGEKSKSKELNYNINQVIGHKKGDLEVYTGSEFDGNKSEITGNTSEESESKKNKVYAGVNYEIATTIERDQNNQEVTITPSIISAIVSRETDEQKNKSSYGVKRDKTTKDSFNLSYDSKNFDAGFKKENKTNEITGDKTHTTTSNVQILSNNISPNSSTVSKDGIYYKADGKQEKIKITSSENGDSNNKTKAGKVIVGYHNNNKAQIDISATTGILENKSDNSKNKSQYTKVNYTQNTFLGQINVEVKKTKDKTTQDGTTYNTEIKETQFGLETDNLNVQVTTSDTKGGEKTRNSELIYSKNFEGKTNEEGYTTYANIDANLKQNEKKGPEQNTSDSSSNLAITLGVRKLESNYYIDYSNLSKRSSSSSSQGETNKNSSSETSIGVGADVQISPGIDAKFYVNHTGRENSEQLISKTNSLTMSLQIRKPKYKLPEIEGDNDLYSQIKENNNKGDVKTFSLNHSKTSGGDGMFDSNGNPITNGTSTSLSFKDIDSDGKGYQISASHTDDFGKKPENQLTVNYIFPI